MQMQAYTPCCESPPSGWQVKPILTADTWQASLPGKTYPQVCAMFRICTVHVLSQWKGSSEQAAHGFSRHVQTPVRDSSDHKLCS